VRTFGASLAKLRKNKDMTQSDLADKLNLTRQAISKYEVGDSFPDISILTLISEIFGVTLYDLINLGQPTSGEAKILQSIATGADEATGTDVTDIINLAPLLKPSILDKMVKGLDEQGIDIRNIMALAQFLSDKSIMKLLETATYDTLNEELIEKLIPFLDEKSKSVIIEKIIDGKYDWHMLKIVSPYIQFMNTSVIEAAVIDGALPEEAIDMMYNYLR
jgi:transcriptional regulator with XRE-family HTH domain